MESTINKTDVNDKESLDNDNLSETYNQNISSICSNLAISDSKKNTYSDVNNSSSVTPYDEKPSEADGSSVTPYDEKPSEADGSLITPYDEKPSEADGSSVIPYDEKPSEADSSLVAPYDEHSWLVKKQKQQLTKSTIRISDVADEITILNTNNSIILQDIHNKIENPENHKSMTPLMTIHHSKNRYKDRNKKNYLIKLLACLEVVDVLRILRQLTAYFQYVSFNKMKNTYQTLLGNKIIYATLDGIFSTLIRHIAREFIKYKFPKLKKLKLLDFEKEYYLAICIMQNICVLLYISFIEQRHIPSNYINFNMNSIMLNMSPEAYNIFIFQFIFIRKDITGGSGVRKLKYNKQVILDIFNEMYGIIHSEFYTHDEYKMNKEKQNDWVKHKEILLHTLSCATDEINNDIID